jgi:hypothetical protein
MAGALLRNGEVEALKTLLGDVDGFIILFE